MAESVGEFYVQFGAAGLVEVAQAFADVSKGMAALGMEVSGVGAQMAESLGESKAQVNSLAEHFGMLGASADKVLAKTNERLAELGKQLGGNLPDKLSALGELKVFDKLGANVDFKGVAKKLSEALAREMSSGGLEQRLAAAVSQRQLNQQLAPHGQKIDTGLFSKVGLAAEGATQAITGLAAAIGPATSSLKGWVMTGVMASGAGQVLNLQFQELARQIASVFAPQVRWLIDQLQQLIRWFQGLSGEQQAGLRWVGLFAMGLGTVAAVLPTVIASGRALMVGIAGIRAAVVALNLTMMTNPIGLALVGVATLVAGIVVATTDWKDALQALSVVGNALAKPFEEIVKAVGEVVKAIREAIGLKGELGAGEKGWLTQGAEDLDKNRKRSKIAGDMWADILTGWMGKGVNNVAKGLSSAASVSMGGQAAGAATGWMFGWDPDKTHPESKKPRNELPPAVGGFEQIEQTYRRIAEATNKQFGGAKDPQQEALDEMKKIGETVKYIADPANQNKPLIVR